MMALMAVAVPSLMASSALGGAPASHAYPAPSEELAPGEEEHDLERHLAKAPTCRQPGNKEYYFCRNCHRTYFDDKATMPCNDGLATIVYAPSATHISAESDYFTFFDQKTCLDTEFGQGAEMFLGGLDLICRHDVTFTVEEAHPAAACLMLYYAKKHDILYIETVEVSVNGGASRPLEIVPDSICRFPIDDIAQGDKVTVTVSVPNKMPASNYGDLSVSLAYAHDHTLIEVPTGIGTCLGDVTAHWRCATCGKVFTDPDPTTDAYRATTPVINPATAQSDAHCFNADGVCVYCAALLLQDDYCYHIGTVKQFTAFRNAVMRSGNTDLCARLTADLDLTDLGNDAMVGSDQHPYCGLFDGQFHNIKLNLDSDNGYAALFAHTGDDCRIQNLSVSGCVKTSEKYAASIVGLGHGNCELNRCISSADIVSTFDGNCGNGGLVARVLSFQLTMNDCGFVGTLQGSKATHCSGLVGWGDDQVSAYNCCVAAHADNPTGGATFGRTRYDSFTVRNSYYVNTSDRVGATGPKQGYPIAPGQLADGSLAWMLSGFTADHARWRQAIGEDSYPVPFDTRPVVYAQDCTLYYCTPYCTGHFTNTVTAEPVITRAWHLPALQDETLCCGLCGGDVPAYCIGDDVHPLIQVGDDEYEAKEKDISLVDGQRYIATRDFSVTDSIAYERSFTFTGIWQPWFAPFDAEVSDLYAAGIAEVAYIAGVLCDADGNAFIAYLPMNSGTVKANTPYVVKPARTQFMMLLQPSLLHSTDAVNTFAVQSAFDTFTFSGVYTPSQSPGSWYALNKQGEFQKMASTATLNPYRLYMTITPRADAPYNASAIHQDYVRAMVIGDETAEGLSPLPMTHDSLPLTPRDLQGRKVTHLQSGQIYTVGGKKYIAR